MKSLLRARKGQFSLIAAFLVVMILLVAILTVYSRIQDNPFTEPVNISSMVTDVNLSIKKILGFTVGYYGSIIEVTGNVSYAEEQTKNYLLSGLESIAHSHVGWAPSFTIEEIQISTSWFEPVGWSMGNLSLTYALPSIGLEGINFTTSALLQVDVIATNGNQSIVDVRREGGIPDLSLNKENFFFYTYNYNSSSWDLVQPRSQPVVFVNGSYMVEMPSEGVDPEAYFIKVVDNRGIRASAFSADKPQYTYTFHWNDALYSNLTDDTVVVEVLQNGSLRWLGYNLHLNGGERPIPPLPVKSLHVNITTVDGVNREVPFQVESWASNYMVPLGLTSNASIFSERDMIVFLVDHNVNETMVWWNGSSTATQTPYAWTNRYFQNDDPDSGILTNGITTLDLTNSRVVQMSTDTTSSRSEFLRINGEEPVYGSGLSYTIHHGIVRDVIQQEPEWSGGIPDCPNVYSHIVLTLPANATYYTFSLRTLFLPSTQNRDITDLSLLQLYVNTGSALTENGTDTDGKPIPSSSPPYEFYNETEWAHHWSEFINNENKGAGIMFRDEANMDLYTFDTDEDKTGAFVIVSSFSGGRIELNPVALSPVINFQDALDITWHGAVVTFGSGAPQDTIYPTLGSGDVGLWVLAEHPPTVTVS